MDTGPIFVVGSSRAGTALVRAMLNSHPSVSLAGETHYFDDLRLRFRGRERGPITAGERTACADYFLALSHRPYGHGGDPELGWISREDLAAAAAARGDGPDAWFEAYCQVQARRDGATRWGEKTPRHAFRLPEILERYPDARVICLIRDPRGIAASYKGWKNRGGFDLDADPTHEQALAEEEQRAERSYHPLIQAYLWNGLVRAVTGAQRRFGAGRVHIQHYESLVLEPGRTVQELCTFLDLEFDPVMLEVPMLNSSFAQFQADAGVSTEPLERWRTTLPPAEIAVVQAACRRGMATLGYTAAPVGAPAVAVAGQVATFPLVAARAVLVNRNRTGSLLRFVGRRVRLLVGRTS